MYPPLLSSNISAVAQKMSESLKKQTWFPVFSLERKTTFWAGSKFYDEMWPALRKGSGWSYSKRTLYTIGTRGGKKNYDIGDYDDDEDEDDYYDDDDDDDDDYNMFSSSQRASNRVGTRGGPIKHYDDDKIDDNDNDDDDDEDDNNNGNGVFFFFINIFFVRI